MANNNLTFGFYNATELLGDRCTSIGEKAVYDMISASLAEHTRQTNALLSNFVEIVTEHTIRNYLPAGGTLSTMDEHGEVPPRRPGSYFDVGFPLEGGATAFGSTRISRAKMTVDDANRFTMDAMTADADWMRRHMLAALFDNAGWTFSDAEHGNITVVSLANNDSVKYVKTGGSIATDNHYLYQNAAIDDDNNPFPTIHTELMEHPSNGGGEVVCMCATNRISSIEDLTNFVEAPDPQLTYGTATTQITQSNLESIRMFGTEVHGRTDRCWIVEWKALPDDYIIAFVTGRKPVGMRQHPEAELQGFFPEASGTGNLLKTTMIRYAGFGVLDRVAACVLLMGAEAYAIPTGYDPPII